MATPSRQEQVIIAHAPLIVNVVKTCQNPGLLPQLDPVLRAMQRYGQTDLVSAIRKILAGSRDISLVRGLDPDDATVIEAILRGLQDPRTLPDPEAKPQATAAAPGLAGMIHAAAHGQPEALHALANMAEQMTAAGGDMARLGGIMRRLVNGERNADELCRGMGAQGQSLVVSILEELGRLEAH